MLATPDAGTPSTRASTASWCPTDGGRQLDGAPSALDVLPGISAAVGGACPVPVDGGVRRGGDVLTALALGADGILVGRPAPARPGTRAGGAWRTSWTLTEELTEAMVLTGTGSAPTTRAPTSSAPPPPTRRTSSAGAARTTAGASARCPGHPPSAEGPTRLARHGTPADDRTTGSLPCP